MGADAGDSGPFTTGETPNSFALLMCCPPRFFSEQGPGFEREMIARLGPIQTQLGPRIPEFEIAQSRPRALLRGSA